MTMEDIIIPEDLGFTPTQQQLDIVAAAKKYDALKIDALAGSSKTSSLVLVANNLPVRSLYLAFNKAMAEEAKSKFPHHVEVRTSHSLAYREVGHAYQHKLQRPYGGYQNVLGTGGEIAKHFRLAPFLVNSEKTITSAALGHAIKSTVNNFEYSADRTIQDKHVSMTEANQYIKLKEFKVADYRQRVLKWAKKLWELRKDINDKCLITHDTYMKLFQLSNPDLSEYEVIYLDEAQDTNACLLELFTKQKTKKIAVGDNLQSIYQFRKAINALEQLDWKECKLTKSFRFGQDVADIANGIALDNDMKVFIQMEGYEKKHTEVVDSLPSNITEGICYIYRTNAALLEEALRLIEQGKKIAIHVDVSDFVNKVESVAALSRGEVKKVKHQDIIIYNSWDDLVEEAKFSKGELARVVKMVATGQHIRVLNLLSNYKPVSNPDIMLITAHKSKGLEFDVVVIGEDFEPLWDNEQTFKPEFISPSERNLLYVACTRAVEVLVISTMVKRILNMNGLWSEDDNINDQLHYDENQGVDISNVEVVQISPEFKKEGLELCDDLFLKSKYAIEAQNQLDVHGDSGCFDEYDTSTNMDGSVRLMPLSSFYKEGHCDLDSSVRIEMAKFGYDAGKDINQLTEFAMGSPENHTGDENEDLNHWSSISPHG
jgi:superfamily I DNA/RNA helicase